MLEQNIGKKIYDFLGRFIAYPNDHARVTHTLWIIHTHLIDAFYTTPRLAILSAEKRCGKTTLLRITKLLTQNPISIVNPSPASLYTLIEYSNVLPTLLLDEIDRTYQRKDTADMTAIVDSGFQSDQTVPRVALEPKRHVEYFKVFCPLLLAGIDNGRLPDTVLDRSICIRLKRRADETVESYRARKIAPQGAALAEELAAWATTVFEAARHLEPTMPDEIKDRDADKWEPLFITARLLDRQTVTSDTDETAVTDALGWWEAKARLAALELFAEGRYTEPTSTSELLLKDTNNIFEEYKFGLKAAMKTEELLDQLLCIDESPWSSYLYGKPLDARGLARLLRPHGIKSKTIRFDKAIEAKGYYKSDFDDAWKRYLPQTPLGQA